MYKTNPCRRWVWIAIVSGTLVHPLTAQESLYVTPGRAVYLIDAKSGHMRYDIEGTVEILSQALRPSAKKGVRYEHHWEEGDFVTKNSKSEFK